MGDSEKRVNVQFDDEDAFSIVGRIEDTSLGFVVTCDEEVHRSMEVSLRRFCEENQRNGRLDNSILMKTEEMGLIVVSFPLPDDDPFGYERWLCELADLGAAIFKRGLQVLRGQEA